MRAADSEKHYRAPCIARFHADWFLYMSIVVVENTADVYEYFSA
jgi:hypothetical protein